MKLYKKNKKDIQKIQDLISRIEAIYEKDSDSVFESFDDCDDEFLRGIGADLDAYMNDMSLISGRKIISKLEKIIRISYPH